MGLIPGLGRSLEKKMATHSSILAWKIPWTEKPGSYSPWCCKELDTTEHVLAARKSLSSPSAIKTEDIYTSQMT